jgi:hypothetical protein
VFATSPVYTEIKPCPRWVDILCDSKIVEREIVREARELLKPNIGLHATSKRRGSQRFEWHIAEIYKDIQSITWHLGMIMGKDLELFALSKRRPTQMPGL